MVPSPPSAIGTSTHSESGCTERTPLAIAAAVLDASGFRSAGHRAHRIAPSEIRDADLVVDPDSSLQEGWTYERTVEEDEDEDGLFVVRVKIVKGRGGLGMEEEYVRLIHYAQGAPK